MPYYAGAIAAAKSLFVAAAVASLLVGGLVSAQQNDNIEVMVCPDPSQSSFAVSEPQSDSVTDQPKTVIRGSIQYISQIDFFIDDVYNNTIALGYSDVVFESTMTLPPGTHTLKIVATDSCSRTVHSETKVITYEPAIQPSIGQQVATQIDGQATPDGEVVSEPDKSVIETIVDDAIVMPLISLGKALDIISLPAPNSEVTWQNTIRSFFFVFGSTLILAAAYIGLLGAVPPRLSFLPYSRYQLIGGLALAGAVMLVLVFIL